MPTDVTDLLAEVSQGKDAAWDSLLELIHEELHQIAERLMRHELVGHTLQATALVHEAYLKLVDQKSVAWRDRVHFFAVASQAMRRILVDHARGRDRVKRGAGHSRVSLDEAPLVTRESPVDLIGLDDALNKLANTNPNAIRVVEMRYFGGLTIEETATVLGLSESSVEREWRYARAWLYQELAPDQRSPP